MICTGGARVGVCGLIQAVGGLAWLYTIEGTGNGSAFEVVNFRAADDDSGEQRECAPDCRMK